MRYCEKCGNELEDNAVVCEKCGNTVVPKQSAVVQQNQYNVICILAFILSIIGFMTAFLKIGIILDIIAIALGGVVLVKSKKKSIKKGLPIAGVVIATLSLVLMIVIYGSDAIKTLNKINKVEKMIDSVGTVTVESNEAITAAEEQYNKLTEEEKAKVDNYEVLAKAKSDYIIVQRADMIEKARLLNIVSLPDEINNNVNVAQEKYNDKIIAFYSTVVDVKDDRIACTLSWAFTVSQMVNPFMSDTNVYFADPSTLYTLNKSDKTYIMGRMEISGSGYYNIHDAYVLTEDEYHSIKDKTNAESSATSE